MTNDLDLELKQVFDQRLGRFQAPSPDQRSRSWRHLAVGVATATFIFACAGVATDVNSVAAAKGVICANAIAKIQLWAQSRSTPLDIDRLVAKMAGSDGCAGTKPTAPSPQKP